MIQILTVNIIDFCHVGISTLMMYNLHRWLKMNFLSLFFPLCRMRYVAAYLLAALGGNASPSAKDIKNILGSVGIEADDERLNKVCNIYCCILVH